MKGDLRIDTEASKEDETAVVRGLLGTSSA